MATTTHDISNAIYDIKEKITDNEYKNLMELLQKQIKSEKIDQFYKVKYTTHKIHQLNCDNGIQSHNKIFNDNEIYTKICKAVDNDLSTNINRLSYNNTSMIHFNISEIPVLASGEPRLEFKAGLTFTEYDELDSNDSYEHILVITTILSVEKM